VTLIIFQSLEIVDLRSADDGDRAASIPIAVVIPARKPLGCTVAGKPVAGAGSGHADGLQGVDAVEKGV
jgi:hypothetical protein